MNKCFLFICLPVMLTLPLSGGIGDIGTDGWTVLVPVTGSNLLYVDPEAGDDATGAPVGASSVTDFRNPGAVDAYGTITAAAAAARDGYPDWILIKRGTEVVDENLGTFKSGQSADAPLVISYYGTTGGRPVIKTVANFIDHNGRTRSNLVLQGLFIYNYKQDPASADFDTTQPERSLRLVGSGENILIEDCKFAFNEIVVQGYQGVYRNVRIRRSIIVDTYQRDTGLSNSHRPSGIFASEVHGLLIEECVWDHNGWSEHPGVPDADANMYNHNLYLTYTCSGKIVRNNIITRGAAHGLQLRGCGVAENNLFVQNAIGMNLGYHAHESDYDTIGIGIDNVILEGRDMDPTGETGGLSTDAVWGVWTSRERFVVENNIVADRVAPFDSRAFPDDNGAITDYVNNTIHQWEDAANTADPGWLDPERSVASYHQSLGKTATFDAFIAEARDRALGTWPAEYEAAAVNAYIREGFSVPGNLAPSVSISAVAGGVVPCTIGFSASAADPDGDSLVYIWKLEDEWFYADATHRTLDYAFGTDTTAAHTYTYPGSYQVKLTVYDGRGARATAIETVHVTGNYPPVSSLTADVTSGDAPLTVQLDASGSMDQNGDSLSYHFDFGDGTAGVSADPTVSHVYNAGNYTVSMFVTDGADTSFIKQLVIAVADPTTAFTKYEVEADALLDTENPDLNFGSDINFLLGDSTDHGIFRVDYSANSDEVVQAKLHIASKYGSVESAVSYVADDAWAESTVTWNNQPAAAEELARSVYVDGWAEFDITDKVVSEADGVLSLLLYRVASGWQEFRLRETSYAVPYLNIETRYATANHSPVALFTVAVPDSLEPLTVRFDASGSSDPDGDSLVYAWDFGDGSVRTAGESVSHSYATPGTYQVSLVADDGRGAENGGQGIASMTVLVGDGPSGIVAYDAQHGPGAFHVFYLKPEKAVRYALPAPAARIQLLDLSGAVVGELKKSGITGKMRSGTAVPGIYLFRVRMVNGGDMLRQVVIH